MKLALSTQLIQSSSVNFTVAVKRIDAVTFRRDGGEAYRPIQF